MSIKSLMINCVESQHTAEYIADVFWKQHIAKVSSITLIPYLKNSKIFSTAYITIHAWCDREVAYNFIQRLKDTNKEARIVHSEDNWWPVEINSHNDGMLEVGAYTSKFPLTYYESEPIEQEERYEAIDRYMEANFRNVTLRAHQATAQGFGLF
jgi:hypothetical protein